MMAELASDCSRAVERCFEVSRALVEGVDGLKPFFGVGGRTDALRLAADAWRRRASGFSSAGVGATPVVREECRVMQSDSVEDVDDAQGDGDRVTGDGERDSKGIASRRMPSASEAESSLSEFATMPLTERSCRRPMISSIESSKAPGSGILGSFEKATVD